MKRVSKQIALGLIMSAMVFGFQNCSKTAFSPVADSNLNYLGNISDSEDLVDEREPASDQEIPVVSEDPIPRTPDSEGDKEEVVTNEPKAPESLPITPSPEFASGPCMALEEPIQPSSQAPDFIFEKLLGKKINFIESANIVDIGSFSGDLVIKAAVSVNIDKISTNQLIVNAVNIGNIGVSGHSCLNAQKIEKVQSRAHAKLRAETIQEVDFRGHLHIYGAEVEKITGAGHVCLYDNAKVKTYQGSIHFKDCGRSIN